MAEERLGASFSIDVSELKAGIAQANRLIRESESEFRAAAAGMDDWTTSEDGLNAKIRSLNDITDIQRKKVDALTAQYDQLIAEGLDPASREAVELRTKINKETTALRKNESELAKQVSALEEMGNAADEAGDDLQEMADDAEESSKGFEGLKAAGGIAVGAIAAVSAACVAAVTSFLGLAESTREAREDMARLDASFAGASLSAESAEKTYKTLYGVMGEADTAVEAAQHIARLAESEEQAAKWAEQAANVQAVFGDALKPEVFFESANETLKLGEATGSFVQMLENTGVVGVDEFNTHLASLNTEQEKQAYMLEVSEKAMGEAGATYREATEDITAAREAEADLSLTLQELGAVAEPILTSLKELAADLLEEMSPFITLIGDGLAGALNGTEGAAESLAEGLSGLISTAVEKIVEAIPFVIETVVAIVPKLIESLLGQLPILLQTILQMGTSLLESIGGMLPTLIPLIVDAVVMIVETLLDNIDMILDAGISLLMGLADGLIVALPRLIDKIPVIIEKLISALTRNLPKLTQMGIELTLKLAVGLIKAIPQLISKIPQIITSIVSGFKNYTKNMEGIGKDLIKGLWNGIKDMTGWINDKIKGFGEDVVDGLKNFFGIKSPSTLMADVVGKNIALGIGEGFTENIGAVNDEITSAMNFEQARVGGASSRAGVGLGGAPASRAVVVNQNNYYSQRHSRLELYKTKQNTAAAVRLAMGV